MAPTSNEKENRVRQQNKKQKKKRKVYLNTCFHFITILEITLHLTSNILYKLLIKTTNIITLKLIKIGNCIDI